MKKLSTLSLLALTMACSEGSKFKAGVATGDAEPAVKTQEEAVPDPEVKSLDLKANSTSALVDMVWVVDNSGSMREEVSQVKANIQKFANSVSERSDLRLSIISNQDPNLGLNLDSTTLPKDYMQIPAYVGSNNGMSILAASVCDKAATIASETALTSICGQDLGATADTSVPGGGGVFGRVKNLENSDWQASVVAGTVKARMRESAVRIFVFVTDDVAKGAVTGENFLKVTGLDASSTHVYAFAGLSKAGACDIAAVGESYLSIAKQTGGEVFDICENDWTANFSKLTENVLRLTSHVFSLPAKAKSLSKVAIDGKVLTEKQYSYSKGKLTIVEKGLLSAESLVHVEYVE